MKKLLLLLLFGMILLIGFVNAFNWSDGKIVSYWSFENTGIDNRSTNNLSTTEAKYNTTAGKIGMGLAMVNTTQVINVSNLHYNWDGANWSWSAWAKHNTTAGSYEGIFSNRQNDIGVNGYFSLGKMDTNKVIVEVDAISIFEGITINDNVYRYYTLVYNQPANNLSFYINGVLVNSTTSAMDLGDTDNQVYLGTWAAVLSQTWKGFIDEVGVWNRTLNQSEITNLYNNGAGCVYGAVNCVVESFIVSVTLNSPANNSQITTNFTTYNATITPQTFTKTNATLNVWFNNGTFYTSQTNTTFNGNISTFNQSLPATGTYKWNVLGVQGDGNGTNSSFATNNFTIRYSLVITNSAFYNTTSYETAQETFTTQITTNGTAPTNAFLVYNTTIKSATISTINSTVYNLSSSMDIPIGVTNNTFYFNFSLGSLLTTTDSFQQNVSGAFFTGCNATYSNDFLNVTFKDEVSNTYINATIPSSTFYYWLGNGTIIKSLTYVNTTDNSYSYLFCASPTGNTFKVNSSISYKQNSTYPQRTFEQRATQSYTSSVTEQVLYLLGSSDGIYVTFQVANTADQVLSGVISNITRSGNLISAGTTGSDGGITYWLNPNHIYTANFFLSPYPFFTATQQFTQTSYTIVLGSAVTSNVSDYQAGINYTIQPLVRYLDNDTIYNFNFTITSSFWSLEAFGFNITNGTGTFIGSASGTGGSGGIANLNVNTSGNQSFRMNYYWTINGTNTTGSVTWLIIDTSGNTFSISRLIDDFVDYVGTGLFGLNNFGIGIIIFVIIIGTTGVLKVKVGISNTATILGVMWALVALFDVSFGILPNPVGAIDNFPTILMGLVFAGVMFKEVFT